MKHPHQIEINPRRGLHGRCLASLAREKFMPVSALARHNNILTAWTFVPD